LRRLGWLGSGGPGRRRNHWREEISATSRDDCVDIMDAAQDRRLALARSRSAAVVLSDRNDAPPAMRAATVTDRHGRILDAGPASPRWMRGHPTNLS
jgi:hypothetical protein